MSNTSKILVKKFNQIGDLTWEYNPLQNLILEDNSVSSFNVDNSKLKIDLNHPIDLQCQESYDGTVNLIMNDDKNPPRIINSRFSVLENNRYKVINRNQANQTNLYKDEFIDRQTRLFRNVNGITKFDLSRVSNIGQLKGGNYVFYLKYSDEDGNETDVVAESGVISIFHGDTHNPRSISGTLADESTDKAILLRLSGVDVSFSYLSIYFVRYTSDLNGVLLSSACKINKTYSISETTISINIDGFESTTDINPNDINVLYNVVESVKTQCQVQNMLFFGNVEKMDINHVDLINSALFIETKVDVVKENIGYLDSETYLINNNLDPWQTEYYSPLNIYYNVGYWSDELYRLGVVLVFNDDTLSPVYNLRGSDLKYSIDGSLINEKSLLNNAYNFKYNNKYDNSLNNSYSNIYVESGSDINMNYLPTDDYIENQSRLSNTKGVFRIPDVKNWVDHDLKTINPLCFKMTISSDILNLWSKNNVKGFFFVRQKRIPTILAQGYSIGVDTNSHVPQIWSSEDNAYITESFLSKSRILSTPYNERILTNNVTQNSGLLCIDASCNYGLQSLLNNQEFKLSRSNSSITKRVNRRYVTTQSNLDPNNLDEINAKLLFVDSDIPLKYVDDYGYSTRAGWEEESKGISFYSTKNWNADNYNIIRGIYAPFIGVNKRLKQSSVYNIRTKNFSEVFLEDYFNIRMNDNSSFYSISDRVAINTNYNEQVEQTLISYAEKLTVTPIDVNNLTFNYKDTIGNIIINKNKIKSIIKDSKISSETILTTSETKTESGIKTITTNRYRIDGSMFNSKILNLNLIKNIEIKEINTSTKITTIKNNSFIVKNIINNIESTAESIERKIILEKIARGDCFTNTVTIRLQRNFTDSTVPINEVIVNPKTWKDGYKGFDKTDDWNEINKSDLNTVPIGSWITWKCLSNFNLGLRSIDRQNIEEINIMGNPRSFFPNQGVNVFSSSKIAESWLLNDGYNGLLGVRKFFNMPKVPYIKDIFDSRLMFSNVQVDGNFKNSYKIFQGLAYQDIDRQYGAIVKILQFNGNIFCCFEHGLALIPVNEKALMSTSTGQSIHLYGAGVLQKQVTLISADYGSMWKDSVIRTPRAIYGFDINNKSIWRFDINTNQFELISDFRIQRFLHDNIDFKELDKNTTIGIKNVKTHYNASKKDVMFTYVNNNKTWNICYNEVLKTWITKYSWNPVFSENIDSAFFSLDQKRVQIYGIINNNLHNKSGVYISKDDSKWTRFDKYGVLSKNWGDKNIKIMLSGYDMFSSFDTKIINIEAYYNDGNKLISNILEDNYYSINNNIITLKAPLDSESIYYNYVYFIINIESIPKLDISGQDEAYLNNIISSKIGLIKDKQSFNDDKKEDAWDRCLQNSFYLHGRFGIYDEINYFDKNQDNQIKPTKWYDIQEPFEFEVVCNDLKGIHKIYNNLLIISNQVEPDSLQMEIIGDVYKFDKENVYKAINYPEDPVDNKTTFPVIILPDNKSYNTVVSFDPILNQYGLKVNQGLLNMNKYGRRIGNISYIEDNWKITIQPLYFRNKDGNNVSGVNTTKIRDKYAKIKIKYSGEKLAIITALTTLVTISYS